MATLSMDKSIDKSKVKAPYFRPYIKLIDISAAFIIYRTTGLIRTCRSI